MFAFALKLYTHKHIRNYSLCRHRFLYYCVFRCKYLIACLLLKPYVVPTSMISEKSWHLSVEQKKYRRQKSFLGRNGPNKKFRQKNASSRKSILHRGTDVKFHSTDDFVNVPNPIWCKRRYEHISLWIYFRYLISIIVPTYR